MLTVSLLGVLLAISKGTECLTMPERCTEGQLRRAAGSSSLEKLKDALQGWTAEEINSIQPKSPIHMAAWQGSLENLQYLVEDVDCCINSISTGEYTYGKTPLFFACTRCRASVASYLLDQGAHVKIVNNKGQSIRSIASSHLPPDLIGRITETEQEQDEPWLNFRETHSDGLEYGDLDPRFLERPLRDTDVVTEWAVNPTTPQSRKGSFLRKNPQRAPKSSKPKKPVRRKPPVAFGLSKEEEEQLEQAWKSVENSALKGHMQHSSWETVVVLSVKRRQAWTEQASERFLHKGISSTLLQQEAKTMESNRASGMLSKIASVMNGEVQPFQSEQPKRKVWRNVPSDEALQKMYQLVKSLSLAQLLSDDENMLVLPRSPHWVDNPNNLGQVTAAICSNPTMCAIDTEWFTDERGNTHVATIQIALPTSPDSPWVIDLVDPTMRARACSLMVIIFEKVQFVLGFAMERDVEKLEEYTNLKLARERCVDIQLLFGKNHGLAACVQQVSVNTLDKSPQCSDWKQRPLTDVQLHYAGLDASILLFLLAEHCRK